jgi:hypothetical protein
LTLDGADFESFRVADWSKFDWKSINYYIL